MIIDNVKIYTEAGTFVSGGIITQGDKITEIYTEAEKENIFKKMNVSKCNSLFLIVIKEQTGEKNGKKSIISSKLWNKL